MAGATAAEQLNCLYVPSRTSSSADLQKKSESKASSAQISRRVRWIRYFTIFLQLGRKKRKHNCFPKQNVHQRFDEKFCLDLKSAQSDQAHATYYVSSLWLWPKRNNHLPTSLTEDSRRVNWIFDLSSLQTRFTYGITASFIQAIKGILSQSLSDCIDFTTYHSTYRQTYRAWEFV